MYKTYLDHIYPPLTPFLHRPTLTSSNPPSFSASRSLCKIARIAYHAAKGRSIQCCFWPPTVNKGTCTQCPEPVMFCRWRKWMSWFLPQFRWHQPWSPDGASPREVTVSAAQIWRGPGRSWLRLELSLPVDAFVILSGALASKTCGGVLRHRSHSSCWWPSSWDFHWPDPSSL